MNESAPQGEPCPRGKDKPESSCKNRQQCWEPCGELGHNMASARVVTPHEAAQMLRPAAPQAAPSVAGWKLVPLEPTQAMIDAFHGEDGDSACNKWDAMLAATPPCPSVAAPTGMVLAGELRYCYGYDVHWRKEFMDAHPSGDEPWSVKLYAVLPLPAVVQAAPGDVHPAAPQTTVPTAAPFSEPRALGQGELPVRALYDELLFSVGNKYPGETRHQTALRYIRQAEAAPSEPSRAALASLRPPVEKP